VASRLLIDIVSGSGDGSVLDLSSQIINVSSPMGIVSVDLGSDVCFSVSGSIDTKDQTQDVSTSKRGVAVFHGDLVVSGNTYIAMQRQSPGSTLADAGTDVNVFISGSANTRGVGESRSSTLFGGDVTTSGSISQVHDPTGLQPPNGSGAGSRAYGYGDILRLGGGSGLNAGKLHYLNNGTWAEAAAAATGTGDAELLGIPMGDFPVAHGVLIRGYVAVSVVGGTPQIGDLIYMGDSNTGEFDIVAPAGEGDIVRIVGYALEASATPVIYFNPSNDWVELI
jgi:hypothetical protein